MIYIYKRGRFRGGIGRRRRKDDVVGHSGEVGTRQVLPAFRKELTYDSYNNEPNPLNGAHCDEHALQEITRVERPHRGRSENFRFRVHDVARAGKPLSSQRFFFSQGHKPGRGKSSILTVISVFGACARFSCTLL